MPNPLWTIIKNGNEALKNVMADLPPDAEGLPMLTATPCNGCNDCASVCPTSAVIVIGDKVTLDRGRCLGCSECIKACPTGTITAARSNKTASLTREGLVLSNTPSLDSPALVQPKQPIFRQSLSIREVSTGDAATDFETNAACNSQFDIARFGIHFVASPRHADALLVTGPVGKAMQDPLRRCYDAMSEPRMVIAAGAAAISGGVFSDGYAEANGVDSTLPVDCYIPGDPPHPWAIVYGILLLMGRLT